MKRLIVILACLLLPIHAWAFPDNGVLDNFDAGADGDTLSANWTTGWASTGTVAPKLMGDGATTSTTNSQADAYWNAATFGANSEAYATITGVTGTTVAFTLGARLVDVGRTTSEGYSVNFNKTASQVKIQKRTNGVQTALSTVTLGDTITKTLSLGDGIGIRVVGTNICAWHKPSGGAWGEIGCREDSSYSAGGKIGMLILGSSTVSMLDDFGGGTVTPACTGASPTWAATSLEQVSVKDCIGQAITGDTVNIPAGTQTWTTTEVVSASVSASSVSISKGITLHGETVCSGTPVTCADNTIIIDGTNKRGAPISITGTNARVTGISFKDPRDFVGNSGDPEDTGPEVVIQCTNCRFDHNSVIDTCITASGSCIYHIIKTHGILTFSIIGATSLVDHNYFKDLNGAVDPKGEITGEGGAANPKGSFSWHSAMTLGDANAVYIEDNNFDNSDGVVSDGASDAYEGSRYVFRFNTVKTTNLGGHGMDSGERSTLRQEIYRNIFNNPVAPSTYTAIQTRGGAHMVWQNTAPAFSGAGYGAFMWITNYRSDGTACSVCQGVSGPLCDGNSYKDENFSGGEGWHCRDQVGVGPDPDNYATDYPAVQNDTRVYSQPSLPTYNWGNLLRGAAPILPADFQGGYHVRTGASGNNWTRMQTKHVLKNRDFYIEAEDGAGVPNFDGTVGTGQGTLAARPATCTAGVAYFATDQGSWNTSSTDGIYNPSTVAGEDGLLYKCTSTNNWELYYTPYTHPHPLQAVALTAPTGLRVITQASGNSACLVWGVSDIVNLAGYRVYHGTSPSSYTLAADIPLNSVNTRHMPDTQYCYSSPVGGTHYFNMTAYNNDIVESALATEVSATFTALSRTTASARSGSSTRDPLQ